MITIEHRVELVNGKVDNEDYLIEFDNELGDDTESLRLPKGELLELRNKLGELNLK